MFQATKLIRTLGLLTLFSTALLLQAEEDTPPDSQTQLQTVLQKIEGNRERFFSRSSTLFGQIPGPVEFAAAQNNLQEHFGTKTAATWTPSASQKKHLEQKYKYWTTYWKARFSKFNMVQPMGVVGVDYTEIVNHPEIILVAVEDDGLAAGLLFKNDVVIGANGRLFGQEEDPRYPLGYALAASQSEAFGGKLVLQLVRKGTFLNVSIALPILPDYSPTFPYDCPRAEAIAKGTVSYYLNTQDRNHLWGVPYLLSTGEHEAIVEAREDVYRSKGTGSSWGLGYGLVGLCEYYLLTGDATVRPAIETSAENLAKTQYEFGTWTHGAPGGYGAVNQVGLTCFLGLALANEANFDIDPTPLLRSTEFFARFVGGAVPYGNHPVARAGGSDNGTSSKAALAFHVLGAANTAERFARISSYMYMAREVGHAEIMFNMVEGPIGAALAPRPEFSMFMRNLIWQYELGRRRDGSLEYLASRRFGTRGATAGLGLVFMLPRKAIRITGAERGVFGQQPPEDLKETVALYHAKKWDAVRANLKVYLANEANPNIEFATALQEKLDWVDAHSVAVIQYAKKHIAAQNGQKAVTQLKDYKRFIGGTTPELEALLKTAEATPTKRYPASRPQSSLTPKADKNAKPVEDVYEWRPLLASATQSDETYAYKVVPAGMTPSQEPLLPTDAAWQSTDQVVPVETETVWVKRVFTYDGGPLDRIRLLTRNDAEVYLNGYRIADCPVYTGNKKEAVPYLLKRETNELLQKGTNVLMAKLAGDKQVDLALEAGTLEEEKK